MVRSDIPPPRVPPPPPPATPPPPPPPPVPTGPATWTAPAPTGVPRWVWVTGAGAAVGLVGLFAVLVLGLALLGDAGPTPRADRGLQAEARARVATRVDALALELDDWWDEELRPYRTDLPVPQLADGSGPVTCDGERIRLDEDLVENAWAGWCSEGLTVAYDPALFIGDVLALELTMAHEWAHLAQFHAPELDAELRKGGLPIDAELQADCLMGAWYGEERADRQVEAAVREVASTGDLRGTPRTDPDAHGSGQQRVESFLAGHAGGVAACLP